MSKKNYPLAFSTLGCPDWTFEQCAEEAAKYGYDALEIRWFDNGIIPSDMSAQRRAEVKQVVKDTGVGIIGLGVSTRFSSPDADQRAAMLDELKRYLELANDLEAPMVRTFGGQVAEGQTVEQTIDWVAESLAAAMPTAEAQGVTVLLETHDGFSRGQEVAGVMAQVTNSRLAAVWDVHHPFRMREAIEDTWNFIGDRVAHIHLKDARLKEDGSWQLVLMGEGEVPCQAIVNLLHQNGYQGAITAEWEQKWHPEIEGPEVAMPQHMQVISEWVSQLS
ncbi:MAG: sugar phosphate isomerase/epimerase family protein [Chloroflexota bacterium]